ncbi:MAG TPA: methyl-accepting chemotaxis protein [Pirellulales bacterium]|nr:methyl-accepting chemotaxis protein [Pirellulales bacterium]
MTATTLAPPATELKQAKAQAKQLLVDFPQEALRNSMIQAAGAKLSLVAESSRRAIGDEIEAVRQSMANFDSILSGMSQVQANVGQIDANVGSVLQAAQGSAAELQQVAERTQTLETHIEAIGGLLKTINKIADQTNLLALNATIEAARAGEAGRGFAVVASEVKELASTTKSANLEISTTLERIAEAVASLSTGVTRTVKTTELSMAAIQTTRERASTIGAQTEGFARQLHESAATFRRLDQSSAAVENEVQEINTIGKTFSYLLELVAAQGGDHLDPLERLGPLLSESTFRAPRRFAQHEPEYVLRADDVLISATDTRGFITFANNCFYEIAEYEPGELVGRPHNVIRHPDMPKTAFADLWALIKAGKLWQGYVANRSKNGRRYWVKANVFPCYENGQIVGYISIRTKPDAAMVQRAVEAYRLVP